VSRWTGRAFSYLEIVNELGYKLIVKKHWTPDISWTTSSLWGDDDYDLKLRPLTKKERRAAKKARKAAKRQAAATTFVRTTPTRDCPKKVSLEDADDPKLRVIFSDFDGVLNTHARGGYLLEQAQVERLDRLARETGAVVVVSSWWRWIGVQRLRDDLASAGFHGRLIGRTPWLGETSAWDHFERGVEIDAVLRYLGDRVESFVILDDHARMGNLLPYLVQTTAEEGLTEGDIEAAKEILRTATPREKYASNVYESVDD